MKNSGRIAGVLYLLLAVFGPFSLVIVPSMLIVSGDATTTITNIRSSELLFRMGIVSSVLLAFIEIALIVVLYKLLESVNRTLSLIAAYARLIMVVIQAVNLLNYLAVLLLVTNVGDLAIPGLEQRDALTMLFLNLHTMVAYLWQMFFGLHLALLGYLVFRSLYIPRFLGILLPIAALAYLIGSFGNVLLPDYSTTFNQIVMVFTIIPELAFTAWLLIKGAQPPNVTS